MLTSSSTGYQWYSVKHRVLLVSQNDALNLVLVLWAKLNQVKVLELTSNWMQRYTFFPNKRKVSQESAFNVAFSSLSAQTDRWIMHLWQKGKEKLNGCWWPHSCYHIISSQLQNRKGGPNWTGGYKKLHAVPKVDNDSLLRLPSSLALTTRWDKVVWNYPIPYFISYPCAIFSGT